MLVYPAASQCNHYIRPPCIFPCPLAWRRPFGDDRYTFRYRVCLEDVFCFKAIHDGHLNVYKNQVRHLRPCHVDTLFSVCRFKGCISSDLKQVTYQLQVLGIVFHNQDHSAHIILLSPVLNEKRFDISSPFSPFLLILRDYHHQMDN